MTDLEVLRQLLMRAKDAIIQIKKEREFRKSQLEQIEESIKELDESEEEVLKHQMTIVRLINKIKNENNESGNQST